MAELTRPNVGAIELINEGDKFALPCRVGLVLWTGTGTAGDDVRIVDPVDSSKVIWRSVATDSNVYQGASFPEPGVHCPNGFTLSVHDASATAAVYVYLREH